MITKKYIKNYLKELIEKPINIEDAFNNLMRLFLVDTVKIVIDDLAFIEIKCMELNGKEQILKYVKDAKGIWQNVLEDLTK